MTHILTQSQRHIGPPELAARALAYEQAHQRGSFTYLCADFDGIPFYAHCPCGQVIYHWD